MIALRDARLVLADRVLEPATLVVDGHRIADVVARGIDADRTVNCSGKWIVPGFIDVHVHGIEGIDTLDPGWPVSTIADRLVRYGVTAFCPTAVACAPGDLAGLLAAVALAATETQGARVLGAHFESNFINPEFRGAQPLACLRRPFETGPETAPYSGADILRVIDEGREAMRIVTLASELPRGLDLIRWCTARGIRASLGHSGATYEEALAAFDAGAAHVTHLFNRMTPLHHREPGLTGAALEREDVMAELICDGFHVHPAAARLALRTKGASRIVAITDATAGAGLPVGSVAQLGGRDILVRPSAAFLTDGTLAGSTLTMDAAFRTAMTRFGCSPWEAAACCSTNPALALHRPDLGCLRPGALADFVVLDDRWAVVETWIDGVPRGSREDDRQRGSAPA